MGHLRARKMSTAYPHPELGPGCRSLCLVTFACLLYLSRACGYLECLSTRVDFMSTVGSDQPSHPGLRADGAHPPRTISRLSMLIVGNPPLPDTPNCEWVVALALASIFPSIKVLRSDGTLEMYVQSMGSSKVQVQRDIFVCRRIIDITQASGEYLST